MYVYENLYSLLNYFIWCSILYISYPVTHILLNQFYPDYQEINPKHKQQYFISNIIPRLCLKSNSVKNANHTHDSVISSSECVFQFYLLVK